MSGCSHPMDRGPSRRRAGPRLGSEGSGEVKQGLGHTGKVPESVYL